MIKRVVVLFCLLIGISITFYGQSAVFSSIKTGSEAIIINDHVNLFKSDKKTSIAQLDKNQRVIVLEKSNEMSTLYGIDNYWWKVRADKNSTGYVFGEFISSMILTKDSKTVALSETCIEDVGYGNRFIPLMTLKMTNIDTDQVIFLYYMKKYKQNGTSSQIMINKVHGFEIDDFDSDGLEEVKLVCDLSSRANEIEVDGVHTVDIINTTLYFDPWQSAIVNVFNMFPQEIDISRAGRFKTDIEFSISTNKIVENITHISVLFGYDEMGESIQLPEEITKTTKKYILSERSYYKNNPLFLSESIHVTPTIPSLRFREDSTLQAVKIGNLKSGDRLTLLATRGREVTIGDAVGSWVSVMTESGTIGWCFDAYLKETAK